MVRADEKDSKKEVEDSEAGRVIEAPSGEVAREDVTQSKLDDALNTPSSAARLDDTAVEPVTADKREGLVNVGECETDRSETSDVKNVEAAENSAPVLSDSHTADTVDADSCAADIDSSSDFESKVDGLASEVESQQDNKAEVKNTSEVMSEDVQSDVCEDSTANSPTVDWNALGVPKQRSSYGGNSEFSAVFNRVVKQSSDAESKGSQQRTCCSLDDLSGPTATGERRSRFVKKTTKVPDKTDGKPSENLQLTTSTSDKQDDVGRSVSSEDKQTGSVVLPETSMSSECLTSAAAKDSSTASKTKQEGNDTKPSSPGEYSAAANTTKSEDTVTTSTGQESSVNVKIQLCEDTAPSSPDKETSPETKTKPYGEATGPLSPDKQSPGTTKTKPPGEATGPLSPDKESPGMTKTKPHTEDTKLLSPDKESPGMTKTKPLGEDTRYCSPVKVSPAVARKKSRAEVASPSSASTMTTQRDNVSGQSPVISVSTASTAESVAAKRNVSPVPPKKTGSFQTHKADLKDSSASVPESVACSTQTPAAAGVTDSVSSGDHKVTTNSSSPSAGRVLILKKRSETNAKDQLPTNAPVTAGSDEMTSPSESVGARDAGTNDRQNPEQAATDTSADVPQEPSGKDQNSIQAGADLKTSTGVSVAKAVPPVQKLVAQRNTTANNEGPASWITAANRRSNQWSEEKVEEFDRKPPKTAADVDDEVGAV